MPDMSQVIQWSAVLIGLLIVAWIVVSQVKKRLMKPDETMSAGFTLADLRALHRAGKMTDAELERAKAVVVEAARKAAERQAQAQKPPGAGRTNRNPR